jgi:hypothetical protein
MQITRLVKENDLAFNAETKEQCGKPCSKLFSKYVWRMLDDEA